ncbi:Maf family protein [Pseudoxanthobacter sp.]|uniref:Maf family protein n=1 Tax=Pseudoxanthobacter sp. TaxID=1925742 RepID=UPI002FE28549
MPQSPADHRYKDRPLVLASRSQARVRLLAEAGIAAEAVPADLDERATERPLSQAGAGPAEIALALAGAKARATALLRPEAIVIGCDQTLDLDGVKFDKAPDVAAARDQLARLCGRTHVLHSAVAVREPDGSLWCHVSDARLTMRPFSNAFLDAYVAAEGEALTGTVGAYRLEGRGIQLFSAIEGDYFTILGLPLLALAGRLRTLGVLLS